MSQRIKKLVIIDLILLGAFIVALWLFPATSDQIIEPAYAAQCSTCSYCKNNGTNGIGICDSGNYPSACHTACCYSCGSWRSGSLIGTTKNFNINGECSGIATKTCQGRRWNQGCYGGSSWQVDNTDYSASDGQLCGGNSGVCQSGACVGFVCGDGQLDVNEECDDGNSNSFDGCSASCNREYLDIGLRIFDGADTILIAVEYPAYMANALLRVGKNGNIYAIALVDATDANASKIRVQTPAGIKALRKL